MPTTPEKQLATMLANIPEKTGNTLAAWKKIITKSGLVKHGEIVKFLKEDHGVSHGFANLITSKSLETGTPTDTVTTQYSGAKESLKPIYDKIVTFAEKLGNDVEIAPKKSSVSLRRNKQFALVTPATKTRIDLGLALKGEDPAGRLVTYNAMCSHKICLESVSDFDKEVKMWMREAYKRSG